MSHIDTVSVNGTEYGISTGGDMPIRAYEGTCMNYYFAYLTHFDPDSTEEFAHISPSFYIRRRPDRAGGFTYDLVVVANLDYYVSENGYSRGTGPS